MQELNDIMPILLALAGVIVALVGVFFSGRNAGIIVERLHRINDSKEHLAQLENAFNRLSDDKQQLIEVLHRAVSFLSAVDLPGDVTDKIVDEVDNLLEEITDDKPVTEK